jgi:hypothetical protein
VPNLAFESHQQEIGVGGMAPSRGSGEEGYVDNVRYRRAGKDNVHIFVPSTAGGIQKHTIRVTQPDGTLRGLVGDLVRAKLLSLRTAGAAPAAKPVAADAPVADSDSDAEQRQSKRTRKGQREPPFSPSKGLSPYELARFADGRHVSTRDCSYKELSDFVASVRPHFAALLRRSPEDVEGAIEALQLAFAELIDDEEAVAEPRAVGAGGASAGGERTAAGGAAAASGAPQRAAGGGEMTAAGGAAAGGTAAGGAVAGGSSARDAARNASDGAARPGPSAEPRVVAGQELRRTLKEIIMLQNSGKTAEARGLAARSQAKRSELGPEHDAKLAKREAELAKKRAQKMRTDFFSLGNWGLTADVLKRFLDTPEVKQLMPGGAAQSRAEKNDEKTAAALLTAAKSFFGDIMSTKGRRSQDDMNAFWAAIAALMPAGLIDGRGGASAARILGVHHRVIKKGVEVRAGLEEHGKGWVLLHYSAHQDRVDLRLIGEWWHSDEGSTEDNQNKEPVRVYLPGDHRGRLGAARRAAARVSAPVSAPVAEGGAGAGGASGQAAGGTVAGGAAHTSAGTETGIISSIFTYYYYYYYYLEKDKNKRYYYYYCC